MGYECPVCATPQSDARHLANHMAFTAVLGEAEHEAWLDEYTPGWSEAGEAELAPRIAEHAPEREFPQMFEDTVGGLEEEEDPTDPLEERSGALFGDDEHGHGHGHQTHGHDHGHDTHRNADPADLDQETREVLEEARELTREMLARDDGADSDDGGDEEGEEGEEDEGDEVAES